MSEITNAREQEGRQQFVNRYRCPVCGITWHDIWDSACNDHCPGCDREIEPYQSDPIPDEDPRPVEPLVEPPKNLVLDELNKTRSRLFDLANAHAGNDKGNAALYLHGACNELARAIRCIERGNPAEPPPMRYVLSAMGINPLDEPSPT